MCKNIALFASALFALGCGTAPPHPLQYRHLLFSPDGKWIVAAGGRTGNKGGPPWGGDGIVKVWAVHDWKWHTTWRDAKFTNPVNKVVFVSDNILATVNPQYVRESRGSPDDGILIRYLGIQPTMSLSSFHLEFVLNTAPVAFDPSKKVIAFKPLGLNGVGLFEIPGLRPVRELEEHQDASRFLAFSPDGSQILSICRKQPFVRLYDVANGKRVTSHNLDMADCNGLWNWATFSNDGNFVAVGIGGMVHVLSADLKTRLFDIETGRREGFAAFSPDSQAIAMSKGQNDVQLYSMKSKEVVKTIDAGTECIYGLCFSPDGLWLAVSTCGHSQPVEISPKVRVFETATGKLVREVE